MIHKISQMSKGLDKLMKGACKGSKPEGTQLFGTTVQIAIITEGAETTSTLSETASKTNSGNDIRSFSEGGLSSGYGNGLGKIVRLYSNYNQNPLFKNLVHKNVLQLMEIWWSTVTKQLSQMGKYGMT